MSDRFKESISVVCATLINDPDMWYGYKSNIAMAFYDKFKSYEEKHGTQQALEDLPVIANDAAEYFLRLWTKDLRLKQPHEQEAVQTEAAEDLAKIVDGYHYSVTTEDNASVKQAKAKENLGTTYYMHLNTSPGDGEYKLADEGDEECKE